MLRVYHSNQLDTLEAIVEFIIERQPLAQPLQPEVILVQSSGMAQWLQLRLAEKFSIAANINFPLPASFIWEMFSRVLPDIPKQSAFNKPGMCWKLMTLIPALLDKAEFTPLRLYLAHDGKEGRLFQLCAKIADLYDQYLVYRPGWLTEWEKGQQVEGLDDAQRWQAPLWRALVQHTQTLGQPKWHRANLYQHFIQTLESGEQCPPGLPSRIFICGISALPPIYLQALEALSKHIDIHLLYTNPCRYYWGDIHDPADLARLIRRRRRNHHQTQQTLPLFKDIQDAQSLFNPAGEQHSGNPLLASWGKLGRDYSFLLTELEQSEEYDVFVNIEPDNLLHSLQADILMLQNSAVIGLTEEEYIHSTKKHLLQPTDRSVTFHQCHSPQREIEVLHDQLLAMFDDDSTLTPRDIIVMVADIDSYSPFIQAVFGSTLGSRRIPFAISDRRARQAHPGLQAFISLLSLPESRLSAQDVLSLLEIPAVSVRFEVTEAGVDYLRKWVSESGVRWGIDDDNVREFDLPATGQHTWRFGLTRMLLGYAMDSKAGEWQDILPYDESSGLIAELAGKLASLLMQLNHWKKQLSQPRSLVEWAPVYHEIVASFFQGDQETEAALALVGQFWQEIVNEGIEAHYENPIPVSLLRDELSQRLENQRISQRFLAGSVNFCTLMPMRAIPFKVICLLGMNDGVYPRTLSPLGFDLMSLKPQRGDRSRRDDDRYLFLEAMLSAQTHFYVSYIGRSIQDNRERYPSVLVEELLDYISQSFCLPDDRQRNCDESAKRVRQHLIQRHTRTPFDRLNFKSGTQLQSYASEWLPAADERGKPHRSFIQPLPDLVNDEISLDQLLRFWKNPVKFFFQSRLGIYFPQIETQLPDVEPFILDNLERFQINQLILNRLIEGGDPQNLLRQYRAAGMLPYGAFGEIAWQKQCYEMEELAAKVIAQRQNAHRHEVCLTLGGTSVVGWLSDVQDDGILRWRASNLKVTHGLQLWIEHLVWCVMGGGGYSRIVGRNASEWRFAQLDADQAKQYLLQLVEGYQQGLNQPLLLLPESGGAWLAACYDRKNDTILWDEQTQQTARNKLLAAWEGNDNSRGEGENIWLQRLYRNLDKDYYAAIIREAEHYLLPLFRFHCPQNAG